MPLRRSLRLALAVSVVALTGAAAPLPASALTGPEEVAFLNAQRAAHGLPADLVEVPEWSAGCAAHMNYLKVNDLSLRHDEGDPNDVNPANHLPGWSIAGRDAGASSVLTSGGASFSSTGRNAFEQAPIHLMQMLSPFMVRSGAADGCLATLRDITRTFTVPTTFSYPGNGATNVPTSEESFEGPFVPAAFVGLAADNTNTRGLKTGPSLYFFNAVTGANAYWSSRGHIAAATLTGPSGPVDLKWVDNYTSAPAPLGNLGQYLAPGGILIPVSPLQKDVQYTASVSFLPDGGAPINRTWSFVTGVLPPAPPTPPAASPAAPPAAPVPTTPAAGSATPDDGLAIVVSGVALKSRSVAFKTSIATKVWVTIEQRKAGKAKGKAAYTLRRSFAADSKAKKTTRVSVKKLARGKYRVRLRSGSVTGDVLAERSLSVR